MKMHTFRCFRCGERVTLHLQGRTRYLLVCPSCGRHVELIADSYKEATKIFKAMFSGKAMKKLRRKFLKQEAEKAGIELGERVAEAIKLVNEALMKGGEDA